MSNIHADLIKNATDMQSQLLEFSHQLSNLSLKSLEEQSNFKMTAHSDGMFTTEDSITNS
jgi:aspartate/tyrosine/aromatic aminotransferase